MQHYVPYVDQLTSFSSLGFVMNALMNALVSGYTNLGKNCLKTMELLREKENIFATSGIVKGRLIVLG